MDVENQTYQNRSRLDGSWPRAQTLLVFCFLQLIILVLEWLFFGAFYLEAATKY